MLVGYMNDTRVTVSVRVEWRPPKFGRMGKKKERESSRLPLLPSFSRIRSRAEATLNTYE